MMKNLLKQNRGVSLVTLAVAVIILLIVTNILIYNAKDSIYIKNLTNMYNDIGNLREKISNYFSIYGDIPAHVKYENTELINNLKETNVLGANDNINEFYVIELNAIEGLTLVFGKDYSIIEDMSPIISEKQQKVNELQDLYIINKNSHNIFYAKGIKVENSKTYYTDDKNIDKEKLNLKYIQGVKIPEGFYYCGGSKLEGIVISDVEGDDLQNTKQGNQFVWVPVESFDEFVREDFRGRIGESEFIDTQLIEGKYYEPTGDGKQEETSTQEMYKSIKENKGFYIARYETGIENDKAVTKRNTNIQTNIKWGANSEGDTQGAVELAEKFAKEQGYTNVKSNLCYGVQWDAIMRTLKKGTQIEQEVIINSAEIGNYQTNEIIKTGSNDKYQIKNIYDLAGNVNEWTMEQNGQVGKVLRGGNHEGNGINNPITERIISNDGAGSDSIGYRIALYITIEEGQWSEVYDQKGIYIDEEGEQAYIPQGFRVSLSPYSNKINNGLVIKQEETQDEYVWIKVPAEVIENRVEDEPIEQALREYTKTYYVDGYEDIWYEGCGLTQVEYNDLKSNMLQSIKENSGFYIGRYEAGIDNPKTSGDISETVDSLIRTNGLPKSQIDKYPYHYITVTQAQKLAQKLSEEKTYTTSLMFGIQWDLVSKFMEQTKALNKDDILSDTSSRGNYMGVEFPIIRGRYTINPTNSSEWIQAVENSKKQKDVAVLLTTGSTKRNNILNIYDMAGNLAEITLEKTNDSNKLTTNRGGSYDNESNSLNNRNEYDSNYKSESLSFRISIF